LFGGAADVRAQLEQARVKVPDDRVDHARSWIAARCARREHMDTTAKGW
jgi:hypothetical protein